MPPPLSPLARPRKRGPGRGSPEDRTRVWKQSCCRGRPADPGRLLPSPRVSPPFIVLPEEVDNPTHPAAPFQPPEQPVCIAGPQSSRQVCSRLCLRALRTGLFSTFRPFSLLQRLELVPVWTRPFNEEFPSRPLVSTCPLTNWTLSYEWE